MQTALAVGLDPVENGEDELPPQLSWDLTTPYQRAIRLLDVPLINRS